MELQPIKNHSISELRDVNTYFYNFFDYLDVKPKTLETYKISLRQFFTYLKRKEISKPTRADIIAYRDSLEETHKPTTIQGYLTAIKLFFDYLETIGAYPNIAKNVKGVKLNRGHKKDYLTPEQIKIILNKMERETLQGKRNYAIFLLMLVGGLRTIEIHRSNIGDIRTIGDSTVLYIQGKGKNEKTDFVKIPLEVEKAIREYLKARGEQQEDLPLFTSNSNNNFEDRLSTRSISKIIKEAMKDSGYNSDRLTAHSLRHTAVTLSLLAGNKLEEVQQFARHSNIATTQIYAHHLDRFKNNCENSIMEAIL